MKTCSKCQVTKPHEGFYRRQASNDGLQGYCKDCSRTTHAVWYDENPEHIKKYQKDHPYDREAHRQSALDFWAKHPEQARANTLFGNAVRQGRIARQPCIVCGKVNAEGHHEDYSKPYVVDWLCNTHHQALHKERRRLEENNAPV